MHEKQLDDIYKYTIYKNYFFIDLIEKKQLDDIYYVVVEALHFIFFLTKPIKKACNGEFSAFTLFASLNRSAKLLLRFPSASRCEIGKGEMAFVGGRVSASPIYSLRGMPGGRWGGLVFEVNCRARPNPTSDEKRKNTGKSRNEYKAVENRICLPAMLGAGNPK